MKKRVLAAVVMAAVLMISACGGDQSSAGKESSAPEAGAAASVAESAQTETAPSKSEAPAEPAAGKSDAGDEKNDAAADGEKVIAYSCYNMAWEFYVTLANGIKESAEAAGYSYINHDQQNDPNKMVQGCTDLLNQGIDCLILTPCKPEAVGAIFDLAKEKGIPVILADISSEVQGYEACLKSDNYAGGVIAAQYIIDNVSDLVEKKKAAAITVDPSNTNISRSEGFKDVITGEGWEIVSELSGYGEADQAYACMQDIITANPDVEVVFVSNAPMAVAASQAISDAGLKSGEDIRIICYDADDIIFDPIDSGEILAAIAQDPYGMGTGSVDLFLKIANGEEISYDEPDEKIIYTDLWVVDASNTAEYR